MRRSSSPKLPPILQIGAMQERHRRFSEVGLKVPLMVRLEGTKVDLGRDIIRNSGLNVIAADDLSDAAEKVVKGVRWVRSALIFLGLLLVTGACATVPQTIPESPAASPREAHIQPYDAGVIFADTCLIRGSSFEDALEGLRVHNVTRNSRTGTYYHNKFNLSVRVTPKECSLVFATREDKSDVIRGLAEGTVSIIPTPPPGVSVTSRELPDGNTYFRLGVKSPLS
jgi:hypothetical protein